MNRGESRPAQMTPMPQMKPRKAMKPMKPMTPMKALPLNSPLKKQARQPASSTNLRQ
jgi:hypothetical protein